MSAKERAKEWLIEWNSKHKLHPSQDECINSLAKLLAAPAPAELGADWPECKDFFDLMQYYRHAPVTDQTFVVKRYDLVKDWLRSQIAAYTQARPVPAGEGQTHRWKGEDHPAFNGSCCSCGWLCEGGHASTCRAEWETHVALKSAATAAQGEK